LISLDLDFSRADEPSFLAPVRAPRPGL